MNPECFIGYTLYKVCASPIFADAQGSPINDIYSRTKEKKLTVRPCLETSFLSNHSLASGPNCLLTSVLSLESWRNYPESPEIVESGLQTTKPFGGQVFLEDIGSRGRQPPWKFTIDSTQFNHILLSSNICSSSSDSSHFENYTR